ncbi:MAG: SagB/ThcOx family dehydrogenase [Candidatus Zixiibacteriota bacterium]
MDSIRDYHNETKHHFGRYARSLGYLDWANQPHPFRVYLEAEKAALMRVFSDSGISYQSLYINDEPSQVIDLESISRFLRFSLGISAWKEYQGSRWALRVNPSSGNLHPTEAYLVGQLGLDAENRPGVWHYRPDTHELERRADFPDEIRGRIVLPGNNDSSGFLVGISSIVWREAWKYGERAFRYCQHDTGHAIAALRLAASLLGWKFELLPDWSDEAIAAICGLHRSEDFISEEREVPEALAIVYPNGGTRPSAVAPSEELIGQIKRLDWRGKANRLSREHEPWPIIDEAIVVAEKDGPSDSDLPRSAVAMSGGQYSYDSEVSAEQILLQRRSAQAFDPEARMTRDAFTNMMMRVMPGGGAPWDSLRWPAHISLLVFVHQVEGVPPGLYMLIRNPEHMRQLQSACSHEFPWEKADLNDAVSLYLLQGGDARVAATLVSCRQEIAGDSCFSIGMIADFEAGLKKYGDWFYRCLFWESGVIGQVLYLEAEANQCRGTGIGCYFDDAVHQLMGLADSSWQSLYHFTVGVPIIDQRLTTEPGYPEESENRSD